jgi:flagellar biogenesis protein FliO
MSRLLGTSVIALALTVSSAALADEAAAPTPAPVTAPAVAAPKPAPAPAKVAAPVAAASAKEPAAAAAPPAPEAAAPAPAPAEAAPPPLVLRPSTPLTLASEPPSTPWIYKVAFGAALLAAGVLIWKRRQALGSKRASGTAVRVLGKTAMGLRGELALVEVGGMRLVVGITPSSMQTLAILPEDYVLREAEAEAAEREVEPRRAPAVEAAAKMDLASRARSLFASLDVGPPVPARASAFSASRYADERGADEVVPESAPAPRRSRAPEPDREDDRRRRAAAREAPLEGQARGIALALRTRR